MKLAEPWVLFSIFAIAMMLGPSLAEAAAEERFQFTPFAGLTRFDREFTDSAGLKRPDDIYLGGRISVRLASPLWLDIAGGITKGGVDSTWSHISANLLLMSSTPRRISPFVSLGGGVSEFKPPVSLQRQDGVAEAAAGVFLRLSDLLRLRLEARNVLLVPKENWNKAHFNNVILGAGLTFAFGGGDHDADRDGVSDRFDKCPNTPVACRIDLTGCPVDSDGDGVCDGADRCAETQRGASVDANGCPKDQDGDGVIDGVDQCPGSSRDCLVDSVGCSSDADRDGVCDVVDRCANTLMRCAVDAQGCPIDSDGDRVCDGIDKCANTPVGSRVNGVGCPQTEAQQLETQLLDTGMIRLQDVKFETAKATIRLESRHTLDVVGEVLSKWPELKIEVGGHCDSRGSNAYNLALSKRRVVSVRSYLLTHFTKLRATQLTARGYGESQPLVENDSPENMARNRRVEFKVLNNAVLKQIKR